MGQTQSAGFKDENGILSPFSSLHFVMKGGKALQTNIPQGMGARAPEYGGRTGKGGCIVMVIVFMRNSDGIAKGQAVRVNALGIGIRQQAHPAVAFQQKTGVAVPGEFHTGSFL